MKFNQYYNLRIYSEMAVPAANRFFLDEQDDDYLQPFIDHVTKTYKDQSPENLRHILTLVLAKALAYRYSNKVIENPNEPSRRKVAINSNFGEMSIKFSVETDTHSKELLEKLKQKGYEPSKFKITRDTSTNIAKRWLSNKFYKESNKVPEIANYNALKDELVNEKPQTKWRNSLSAGQIDIGNQRKGAPGVRDHTSRIASLATTKSTKFLKEPIPLNDDDKEIIAWFERRDDKKVPGKEDEKVDWPKGLENYFMARYSPELFKLSDSEKWPIPLRKTNKSGDYINWKKYQGVPAHLDRLKIRLDELAARGVDFYDTPLTRGSARRWIQRGTYYPAHKKALPKDITFSGGGYQHFKDEQDKHIKDSSYPSPNIPTDNPKHHTEDNAPWDKIIQNDATHAARIALRKTGDRSGQGMGSFDLEGLTSDAMLYLTSDEASSNHNEYAQQSWRISAAVKHLSNQINKELKVQRKGAGDADMTGMGGSRANDDELEDKEDKIQTGLAKWKFPSLEDVKDEPDGSPAWWKSVIKTNIYQYKGISDDKIALTVGKMLMKFKELNGKDPNEQALKHMIDMVVDSKPEDNEDDKPELPPSPPITAMDAMRKALEPSSKQEPKKPLPLKSIAFKPEEVPDSVTATPTDAKITGGTDFKSYLAARRKAPGPLSIAKLEPPKPEEIPVPKKKKLKPKPGPGLFDDY